jgi:hypothetical protein
MSVKDKFSLKYNIFKLMINIQKQKFYQILFFHFPDVSPDRTAFNGNLFLKGK